MAYLLLLRGGMGAGKTTVAAKLRESSPGAAIIEVDEVKLQKYATTKECIPNIDFREAGAEAKKAMVAGRDAIVIEPLCEQQHVGFVLHGAGLSGDLSKVRSVWLHCSLETALLRKGQSFCRADVETQYQRYPTRYKLDGEIVIDTDKTSVWSAMGA